VLIEAGGLAIELLSERAAWIADSGSLLVADLHLGKAQSFRRAGVPVPTGTTAAMLARLDRLIERFAPRELVVLGDLLHGPLSQRGPVIDALAQWRVRHAAVGLRMVRGNHDHAAGDPPSHCGIEVIASPWRRDGIALCHDPEEVAPGFKIAGHLHPVVSLRSRTDRARVACFWLRADALVLPAFGEFTGGWPVQARAGEQLFVIAGREVMPYPRLGAIPRIRRS